MMMANDKCDVVAAPRSFNHSPAFMIYSIIHIGHSSPIISWFQSQDRKHLTCGTNFLLLFMFLSSSVRHHHPALLHCHAVFYAKSRTNHSGKTDGSCD